MYLKEATTSVRENAFYMKRAMDSNDLQLTLNHCSEMLRELRTCLLSPKDYYDLCKLLYPLFFSLIYIYNHTTTQTYKYYKNYDVWKRICTKLQFPTQCPLKMYIKEYRVVVMSCLDYTC